MSITTIRIETIHTFDLNTEIATICRELTESIAHGHPNRIKVIKAFRDRQGKCGLKEAKVFVDMVRDNFWVNPYPA